MTAQLQLAAGAGLAPEAERLEESPLAVRGLTVTYAQKPAVFSVDMTVPAGSMTAIVGPNGAGKSTLLKAALGIVSKVSGQITVFGRPIDHQRHRIAYVPQRASVDWDFPTQVLDVVLMGFYRELGLLRRMRGYHRAQARRYGWYPTVDPKPGRTAARSYHGWPSGRCHRR